MNPSLDGGPHRYRVTLGDVDAAGIIFFANVFRWHESRLSTWLADLGRPLRSILDADIALPTVASSAEYPASAFLDDILEVRARTHTVTDTSFVFETTWARVVDTRSVAVVRTTHVSCRKTEDGLFVRTTMFDFLRDHLGSERS